MMQARVYTFTPKDRQTSYVLRSYVPSMSGNGSVAGWTLHPVLVLAIAVLVARLPRLDAMQPLRQNGVHHYEVIPMLSWFHGTKKCQHDMIHI